MLTFLGRNRLGTKIRKSWNRNTVKKIYDNNNEIVFKPFV